MSALYPGFLQTLLSPGVNLVTADVRAQLIDTADEVYLATDNFLSDITAAGLVGSAVALANKTVTNGVFDADDTTIPAVSGDSVEAVLLYINTGVNTTSRLIGFFDGVALTPNGSGVLIQWPSVASRIFAL